MSNAAGIYYFSNIPAGTYYIEASGPPTFGLTGMDQGGNDNLDSDFDGEDARTVNFVFPSNGSISNIDAGFFSSIIT